MGLSTEDVSCSDGDNQKTNDGKEDDKQEDVEKLVDGVMIVEEEEEEQPVEVQKTKKAKVKPPETEEDKKKKYVKFIARLLKKEKNPQVIHSRLIKKFGEVMTALEVAAVCTSEENKAAEAQKAASDSSSTPPAGRKRHRTEKSGEEGKKKKIIGRPADEEKQKTIIETVKHNPTISLRSVAASVDCSKSQVARILALNGYTRNKGRIGEWQQTSPKGSDEEKDETVTSIVEFALSHESLSTNTVSVMPKPKTPSDKAKDDEPDNKEIAAKPDANVTDKPEERPRKKKRTQEQ